MTREDALKLIPLREKNWGIVGQGVINKIYDEFESRTCENCKHFIDSYVGNVPVKDCTSMLVNYPPKDFGCRPYFERKEDEK